ncbi:hypothetical protein [uncultured Jatrophihabitans sp.]|uniref:hypothetical protein n=1 Tax=uncultured Jatrophihabitans sp. TaxID=1610747 RepID=UPI0035CC5370
MPVLRSGPLAAWANAHLAGRVGIDQVVDAVTGRDAAHRVESLPDGGATLLDLLTAWRRDGGPVRCALPVAGDVRGLAGPATYRSAALVAGEAVATAALGAVPDVVDYAPSSNPSAVTWQVFALEPAPADHLSVADAQYELTGAIRESASALAAAQVAQPLPGDDALHAARRAGERVNLPPGFPQRAVTLLAQAERIAAIVDLALVDPLGGAVDRIGIGDRDAALRPLATAARRARMAAYNATAGLP